MSMSVQLAVPVPQLYKEDADAKESDLAAASPVASLIYGLGTGVLGKNPFTSYFMNMVGGSKRDRERQIAARKYADRSLGGADADEATSAKPSGGSTSDAPNHP